MSNTNLMKIPNEDNRDNGRLSRDNGSEMSIIEEIQCVQIENIQQNIDNIK